MGLVRRKNYQEPIPLPCLIELDYNDLDLLKLHHISWMRLLGEVLCIAPPYSNMEKTLLETYSHIHYHQIDGKIWAYDIAEMAPSLELDFSIMITITT
jgi:hypothetical protein